MQSDREGGVRKRKKSSDLMVHSSNGHNSLGYAKLWQELVSPSWSYAQVAGTQVWGLLTASFSGKK